MKRVDNSRLVRQADPRARKHCWSVIAIAAAAVILSIGILTPSLSGIRAGYKLEALKAEERRLLDERRALELEEARLLSPARLQELADMQRMTAPLPGQVVRLDMPGEDSLARLHEPQP